MSSLESFLWLCGLQTLAFSLWLLIFVTAVQWIGRRRATMLIASGLAAMVMIWLVALLPIPGWLTSDSIESSSSAIPVHTRTEFESADSVREPEKVKGFESKRSISNFPDPNAETFVSKTMVAAWQQIKNATIEKETADAGSGWWSWISIAVLVAIGLGLLRLLLAYWTIGQLVARSRKLSDRYAIELLDTLRAKLSCRREIELLESDHTEAAFTVGFLRPKICLSKNWRQWQEPELTATLAHEVAHINNGDFLQRVIAQFSSALNFYNPIVHYLCGQLCINQEFNADAQAAAIVGGQKNYLNSLASIALQNDYTNHRLAPMFLPTRKSFFRRIEMLRSKKLSRVETPTGKLTSLVIVSLVAICVVGFRFPIQSASAHPANEGSQDSAANLRCVADDADVVMIFRPARLLKNRIAREAYDAFKTGSDRNPFDEMLVNLLGLKAEAIDQLTGIMYNVSPDSSPDLVWIAQVGDDGWWSTDTANLKSNLLSSTRFRGHMIFTAKRPLTGGAYAAIDNKTLVCAVAKSNERETSIQAIKSAIRSIVGPTARWSQSWEKVAKRDLSFVAKNDSIDILHAELLKTNSPFLPILSSVMESSDFMVVSANYGEGKAVIESEVQCAQGTDMAATKEAMQGLSALAKTMLRSARQELGTGSEKSPVGNATAKQVLDLPLALLQALKIDAQQNQIILKTELSRDQKELLTPLIPAIVSTRTAAIRVESANRIRMLMLAMLNYESAHGHFPRPVLTSPSGKKYSWRVAILPYLEEQKIYENYRFDEDWNSDHNRKVTAQIPRVFQHPMASGSKYCSYFVLSGKGTAFGNGDQDIGLVDFMDGTSNTLGIVEAKRNTHWAEPRDISYVDGNLDTKVGGFTPGGFNASLCDGSTHYWSTDINQKVLSFLIERSDGRAFSWDQVKKGIQR